MNNPVVDGGRLLAMVEEPRQPDVQWLAKKCHLYRIVARLAG